jgi:hypothetical protein
MGLGSGADLLLGMMASQLLAQIVYTLGCNAGVRSRNPSSISGHHLPATALGREYPTDLMPLIR